jgi:N-sulfoglucosamine sulfohydrolase
MSHGQTCKTEFRNTAITQAMNRLASVALTALLMAPPAALYAADVPVKSKPNIVFIMADDVTYKNLGCYGEKAIQTPNIDRLAQEGMKFTRAYCATAMCAPFRAEVFTGLYPVRSGVAWNHSAAKPDTKSICHYLSGLNYRVGVAGKKHAGPADVFPFERVEDFPTGDGVRRFITRDPKQPFCLFLCSTLGHSPWRVGDTKQVDSRDITLPPTFHDNPITRQTYVAYLAEVAELDKQVGAILRMVRDTGQEDSTLVMFSSEQGWAFAFGKWSNWDIGVHTALIARWPGRIQPGTVTDALVQMADVTPTFIEAAGGDPVGFNLDGTSFLPVLTGAARTHREYVYGLHNNVREGNPYPIRSIRDGEFHYILNLTPEESYHEKHLMTAASAAHYDLQWWQAMTDAAEQGDAVAKKLQQRLHHRPAEELYRVDADPYELNNLANDPDCAAAKDRLRAELERWMKSQKDSGAALDSLQQPRMLGPWCGDWR